MKTSLASFNLILMVGVLALAGRPASSPAQSFGFPGTVSAAGAQWYVSDNMTAIVATPGNPGPGGFGFSDADFANAAAGLDGTMVGS